MFDEINKAEHYNSHPSGVECITIIEWMSFNCGTAIKYLWRAGLKPGNDTLKDLKKAEYYIKREIQKIQHLQYEAIQNAEDGNQHELKKFRIVSELISKSSILLQVSAAYTPVNDSLTLEPFSERIHGEYKRDKICIGLVDGPLNGCMTFLDPEIHIKEMPIRIYDPAISNSHSMLYTLKHRTLRQTSLGPSTIYKFGGMTREYQQNEEI